jgi:hypothetical protein
MHLRCHHDRRNSRFRDNRTTLIVSLTSSRLGGRDARQGRKCGSARGQMQKLSAGKFHGDAPTNLNTLRKCRRGFRIKVRENSAAEFHAVIFAKGGR